MVPRLLSAVGWETRGMHEAAYIVAAFAFLSQLLGLLRDRLLAGTFGAGGTLDIYYGAFRIPDFLFATVASLLSLYALLPILSRLEEERPGYMLSFMRRTLLLFFVAMGIISAIAYLLSPQLISFLLPGLASDPVSYEKLLLLTRILLLQPILLGASNILANLTQLRQRFVLYSISPLLYNIGIIVGVVFLYPFMGVAGLGWGVVGGAALHMLVQVPFFTAERGVETIPLSSALKQLLQVLMLSVPRTLTLAAGQISLLAIIALASLLSKGSIAVFSLAYNLQAVPLTIIGISYSVAAFPTLARLFAAGNRDEFLRQVSGALRHIFFWSIPATILIIVLRAQMVRVILGSGLFDWTATRLTAAALALFILSLLAQSAMFVIGRAYYAAGNTRKPLFLAVLSVAISITSAFVLVAAFRGSLFMQHFFQSLMRVEDTSDTVVLMLSLGYSLGPIIQFLLGLTLFSHDFSLPLKEFKRLFWQSMTAAVIGGFAGYAALALLGLFLNINKALGVFAQGFGGGVIGLVVTALMLHLMHNRELRETIEAFNQRFKDRGPVALEPTDIAS